MRNVRIAFEKLDGTTEQQMRTGKVRLGYSYCSTHMIRIIHAQGEASSRWPQNEATYLDDLFKCSV